MTESIIKAGFGIDTLADSFGGYNGKLNKKKRLLHERAHLALEFPQSNDRVLRTYIPFLENPQINERGKARLNTYDLVGRAGQLFSYGGAESRRISVSFNISLLHVLETDITEGIAEKFLRQFNLFFTDREQAKQLFDLRQESSELLGQARLQADLGDTVGSLRTKIQAAAKDEEAESFLGEKDQKIANGRDYSFIHREYYRNLIGAISQVELESQDNNSFLGNLQNALEITTRSQGYKNLDKIINMIYCWVNLIRASVMNNSTNSLYGPPIARLTYGPMYNNVPCLIEDYSVKIMDEAGFEVQTLTPKRIQITLNMVESRTGDFGKYVATAYPDGDNITGWESIIENNELDPINGLIGGGI